MCLDKEKAKSILFKISILSQSTTTGTHTCVTKNQPIALCLSSFLILFLPHLSFLPRSRIPLPFQCQGTPILRSDNGNNACASLYHCKQFSVAQVCPRTSQPEFMTTADCRVPCAQTVMSDATIFAWLLTFSVRDCVGLGLDGSVSL